MDKITAARSQVITRRILTPSRALPGALYQAKGIIMSSYVVDPKTINTILSGLEHSTRWNHLNYPDTRYSDAKETVCIQDTDKLADLGYQMYALNLRAVSYRYPDGLLPGTYSDGENLDAYTYRSTMPPTAIQLYKSIKCWLYQCCDGEHDQDPLYTAFSTFAGEIAEHIVTSMPEYEALPWE